MRALSQRPEVCRTKYIPQLNKAPARLKVDYRNVRLDFRLCVQLIDHGFAANESDAGMSADRVLQGGHGSQPRVSLPQLPVCNTLVVPGTDAGTSCVVQRTRHFGLVWI